MTMTTTKTVGNEKESPKVIRALKAGYDLVLHQRSKGDFWWGTFVTAPIGKESTLEVLVAEGWLELEEVAPIEGAKTYKFLPKKDGIRLAQLRQLLLDKIPSLF